MAQLSVHGHHHRQILKHPDWRGRWRRRGFFRVVYTFHLPEPSSDKPAHALFDLAILSDFSLAEHFFIFFINLLGVWFLNVLAHIFVYILK